MEKLIASWNCMMLGDKIEYYLYEFQPIKRTFLYENANQARPFRIHLPYTYLFLKFSMEYTCHTVYCYGSELPMTSLKSELFGMPLPNTYESGLCCLGNGNKYYESNKEFVQDCINLLFFGVGTHDVVGLDWRVEIIGNYFDWEFFEKLEKHTPQLWSQINGYSRLAFLADDSFYHCTYNSFA